MLKRRCWKKIPCGFVSMSNNFHIYSLEPLNEKYKYWLQQFYAPQRALAIALAYLLQDVFKNLLTIQQQL